MQRPSAKSPPENVPRRVGSAAGAGRRGFRDPERSGLGRSPWFLELLGLLAKKGHAADIMAINLAPLGSPGASQ